MFKITWFNNLIKSAVLIVFAIGKPDSSFSQIYQNKILAERTIRSNHSLLSDLVSSQEGFVFAGPYMISEKELAKWYHIDSANPQSPTLPINLFGSFTLINDIPTHPEVFPFGAKLGEPFRIANPGEHLKFEEKQNNPIYRILDGHYPIYNNDGSLHRDSSGKIILGTRILPIADREGILSDDLVMDPQYWNSEVVRYTKRTETYPAKKVIGSEIVDQALRNHHGLKESEPIFAIVNYFHPEKFVAPLSHIDQFLKTEMGITHTGAYLGKGVLRNSPFDYHDQKWKLWEDHDDLSKAAGYPAMVHTMSMQGVPQSTLNQNILIGLRILNEFQQKKHRNGVVFPLGDYKFDDLHAVTLKEVLNHYRAWIDPEWVNQEFNQKYLPFGIRRISEILNIRMRSYPEYRKRLEAIAADLKIVYSFPGSGYDRLLEIQKMKILGSLDRDLEVFASIKKKNANSASFKKLQTQIRRLITKANKEIDEKIKNSLIEIEDLKNELANLSSSQGAKEFIENTPYIRFLRESDQLSTYCNEHIFMALNLGVNLPQNIEGYRRVYGKDGDRLWQKANAAWREINRLQIEVYKTVNRKTKLETKIPDVEFFEPLWAKPEITEYGAVLDVPYYRDPLGGKGSEQKVGKALVWHPVTTADLLFGFMETYLGWQQIGAARSGIVIYGFSEAVQKRMGMSPVDFIGLANKFVARAIIFDVILNAPANSVQAYLEKSLMSLLDGVSYLSSAKLKSQGISGETAAKQVEAIKNLILFGDGKLNLGINHYLKESLPDFSEIKTGEFIQGWIKRRIAILPQNHSEFRKQLLTLYQKQSFATLRRFRQIDVEHSLISQIYLGAPSVMGSDDLPKNVKYYAPPKTIHSIVLGQYSSNPYIQFQTIGTALDVGEAEYHLGNRETLKWISLGQ